ncbi:hypothetical protein ABKN59_008384 [Abortiporus biennis]
MQAYFNRFPSPYQTGFGKHLPVELYEMIIDFLSDDKETLSSCALVSRSWVARSQLHLFNKITVRGVEEINDALDPEVMSVEMEVDGDEFYQDEGANVDQDSDVDDDDAMDGVIIFGHPPLAHLDDQVMSNLKPHHSTFARCTFQRFVYDLEHMPLRLRRYVRFLQLGAIKSEKALGTQLQAVICPHLLIEIMEKLPSLHTLHIVTLLITGSSCDSDDGCFGVYGPDPPEYPFKLKELLFHDITSPDCELHSWITFLELFSDIERCIMRIPDMNMTQTPLAQAFSKNLEGRTIAEALPHWYPGFSDLSIRSFIVDECRVQFILDILQYSGTMESIRNLRISGHEENMEEIPSIAQFIKATGPSLTSFEYVIQYMDDLGYSPSNADCDAIYSSFDFSINSNLTHFTVTYPLASEHRFKEEFWGYLAPDYFVALPSFLGRLPPTTKKLTLVLSVNRIKSNEQFQDLFDSLYSHLDWTTVCNHIRQLCNLDEIEIRIKMEDADDVAQVAQIADYSISEYLDDFEKRLSTKTQLLQTRNFLIILESPIEKFSMSWFAKSKCWTTGRVHHSSLLRRY